MLIFSIIGLVYCNHERRKLMRRSTVLLCTLLISSSIFAANNRTTLNTHALANTILNAHNLSSHEKGSFAIVYGGQDISREARNSTNTRADQITMLA